MTRQTNRRVTVVEVKIPLEILEQLEAVAKAEGKTRHYAIREAIAEWVDRRSNDGATDEPEGRQGR